MKGKQLRYYQESTKLQKDIIDALINMGFKYKYFDTYEKTGFSKINVSKISKLEDLISLIHEDGKNQKRFEIQKVIGL